MLALDLLNSAHLDDPYPTYQRLRAAGRVVALDDRRFVVTSYGTAAEVLRDHETFSSRRSIAVAEEFFRREGGTDMAGAMGAPTKRYRTIISSDPPDHTRIRSAARAPFLPSAVAAQEPKVRAVAEACVADLLDAASRGDADFVRDVAFPLPVIVIADLLGAPRDRREDFKRWSDNLAAAGASVENASAAVGAEMFEFFDHLVADRRQQPRDDIVSSLLEQAGDDLDPIEIVVFCQILLIAGNETTTNLLGNWCSCVLLERPDLATRLGNAPGRIPPTIEEALRFESPFQGTMRTATRDADVAGTRIPSGSSVLVLLGAANRDPAVFPEADSFVADREPNEHLAFGSGIHSCLGAWLARLEARVLAETVTRLLRSVVLRGSPERSRSGLLRGFRTLPVHAEPAA